VALFKAHPVAVMAAFYNNVVFRSKIGEKESVNHQGIVTAPFFNPWTQQSHNYLYGEKKEEEKVFFLSYTLC